MYQGKLIPGRGLSGIKGIEKSDKRDVVGAYAVFHGSEHSVLFHAECD